MGRAYINVFGTVAVVLFGYLGYRRGQKELLSRYGKLDKDGRYVYHADGTLERDGIRLSPIEVITIEGPLME